jgi:hypothetical protein
VTVTNTWGTSVTSAADLFSYEPPPTVTAVEPNHGPAAGGTSVTITGTSLTGASAVKFGSSNAASFKVNSDSSITAVSPAGTGTVDLTATTPSGTSATSSADRFTYGPTVTKVEPNHGSPSGGTTVTITGTGFTGATAVKFGAANAAKIHRELGYVDNRGLAKGDGRAHGRCDREHSGRHQPDELGGPVHLHEEVEDN